MHLHGQKNRSIFTQCPWRGPSTFPLFKFTAKTVGPILKKILIDRCPEDVPTNIKLVWNNSFPHLEEKLLGWGWTIPPPPPPPRWPSEG